MISQDKQIKVGTILSYFGVFLGMVSGLIYNPWMIHKIGSSDYGLYTLAMSLINIFLIDFGLSMASQRYISKYRAENNQQAVDCVIGLIFKLYLIITAILALVFALLYFFLDIIYVKLDAQELEIFKVLYIMIAIYSVTSFPFITLNGILSSYEKYIQLKICDLLYKILTVILTAIALFAGYGVFILSVVNLISSIIVTGVRIIFIKRYTPVKANLAYQDATRVKELFAFSIWSFVPVITSRLLFALGPSILGIVSGSVEIAVFGYAVSIEGYIYLFVNAINGFFMPQLSRISADKSNSDSNTQVLDLMISVGKFILILFGLVFVGFAALGKDFILFLVGVDYIEAYYCVLLMCGYGMVAYPQQIANTYAIVQNKVKDCAMISLISFGAYLLSVFALGKQWGALGVGVAICFSLIVQTFLMNVLYARKLNINIGLFFKECHFKMLPGFALFTSVSIGISRLPWLGWGGFVGKTALITLSYIAIAWTMFLSKSERSQLTKTTMRR